MRYRTGKTRSYTLKRNDTKVTNKNSENTFESKPANATQCSLSNEKYTR